VLLPQLRRVRWAVRATLVLGVAASVVANVLHARDNPVSQAIAAWPPLALLLTVELISRVPVHRRSLAFARLFATATIAGIAAWVSYWHMAGVAARYGETGASPYLLPLSVDGLIIVASICLVELGGRISSIQTQHATAAEARATAVERGSRAVAAAPTIDVPPAGAQPLDAQPTDARFVDPQPTGAQPAAAQPAAAQPAAAQPAAAQPAVAQPVAAVLPTHTRAAAAAALAGASFNPTVARQVSPAPRQRAATPAKKAKAGPAAKAGAAKAAGTGVAASGTGRGRTPGSGSTPKPRRSAAENAARAAGIQAERPDVTDAEVAAELGISVARLRTVRREHPQPTDLRLAA
jgi:hypothetical protein